MAVILPAEHVPFSCRLLGHVMRVEDPSLGLFSAKVCKRNGCTHRMLPRPMPPIGPYAAAFASGVRDIVAETGDLRRSVPEGATSVEVSAPKPRRETKFTVSIYCGNCHTVGDYQFRKGTILHAANDFTWAEYRNGTPTDRKATIRLNNRTNGTLVECRFCKCSTALTIRERNGETTS